MTPATRPMMTALPVLTEAQGAVIPTSPAKAPLRPIDKSVFLNLIQDITIAPMAPAAAANVVVTATWEIPPMAAKVEPGLNPYQPNHRIKTPSVASGRLCG